MIFGKHINKYYIKYGIPLILGVLVLLIVDWYNLAIPRLFGEFIDDLKGSLTEPFTNKMLWTFIIEVSKVALIMAVGRFLWRIFIMGTSRQIQYKMREQLFNHALTLDQPYYQTHKVGAIMAYFSNDLESIRMAFGPALLMLVDSLALGSFILIRMFTMDYRLTLISIIPLFFLAIAAFFIAKKMRMRFRMRQDAFETISDFTQESFSGLSVIKAFVKEVQEAYNFKVKSDDFYDKHMDFVKNQIWFHIIITIFINLTLITLLGVGSIIVIYNPAALTIGQLTEFFSLFGTLVWPVMALTRFASMRSQSVASYQRIERFLDSKPLIIDGENIIDYYVDEFIPFEDVEVIEKQGDLKNYKVNYRINFDNEFDFKDKKVYILHSQNSFNIEKAIELKPNLFLKNVYEGSEIVSLTEPLLQYKIVLKEKDKVLEYQKGLLSYPLFDEIIENCVLSGKITFKNLNFSYPDAPDRKILKDISLTINEGERIGILGRTGSGKSTFVDLLLRIYNVDNQTIFLDDQDIMQLNSKCVRENIAYVPQDNFLYSTTIKENIGFSKYDMDIDEIHEAAKLSDVYSNIVDFKDGFDTILGERGITVSGGQKQRISIARALAKNAPILILDDSVSAVDTNTEDQILSNLNRIRKGKTTILIAHRISTVRKLDKIILLDEGRVLDIGSHDELLKRSTLYKEMVDRQALESKVMGNA
ncbi:MAG: ABC transporter ATP-binding protein [Acholeplasmatales bacterium]